MSKQLWPELQKQWLKHYESPPIGYVNLFGPIAPPTRWQRFTYAVWRKHWYGFADWVRDKICGDCR